MEEEKESKVQKKFFTKLNLGNKNKPKNTVYDVFFCVKIDTTSAGDDYIGSWVSSIDRDDIYNKDTTSIKVSGDERDNHIRIRLKGLLETLQWIVGNTNEEMYKHITVNLCCNDPYVVNLVNEWIPNWSQTDFNINDEDERPNKDLLSKISAISTKINIKGQWISCKTQEMSGISTIVDESLQKLLIEQKIDSQSD